MKSGFALGFVYATSLGAIIAGNGQDLWSDDLDGPLILLWAGAGLAVVIAGVLRRND